MIRVTFKDVGQGDSIIVESFSANQNRIIIIDCNIHPDGSNPVLKWIIVNKVKFIDFIFLTHPHYDHFSGLNQVFDYCIDNKIGIGYFLHTMGLTKAYIRGAVKTATAEQELLLLCKKIRILNNTYSTKIYFIQADYPEDISIHPNYKLRILSPSASELDKSILSSKMTRPYEEDDNNVGAANALSTILYIYSDTNYFILSADAEQYSFARVETFFKKHVDGKKKLVLAQASHHGSAHNYNGTFWTNRKSGIETPIVFSVGTNKYGHPAEKVIKKYFENSYKVYSTNFVGGLKGPIPKADIIERKSAIKSFGKVLAKRIKRDRYNGDQAFEISDDNTTAKYISSN